MKKPHFLHQDINQSQQHDLKNKDKLKPIVKTHIAFWVPVYIKTLNFLCAIMGTHPDPVKRRKIIAKGIRWERIQ